MDAHSGRRPGHGLLRKWRNKEGLSQSAVGTLCGVKQTVVSDWETGRKCPGLEAGTKLATVSKGKVPVDAWFGQGGDDEPSAANDVKEAG